MGSSPIRARTRAHLASAKFYLLTSVLSPRCNFSSVVLRFLVDRISVLPLSSRNTTNKARHPTTYCRICCASSVVSQREYPGNINYHSNKRISPDQSKPFCSGYHHLVSTKYVPSRLLLFETTKFSSWIFCKLFNGKSKSHFKIPVGEEHSMRKLSKRRTSIVKITMLSVGGVVLNQ